MKVKIQELKENPGILPFKLGTSKVKIASHTFLYYINIPPIIHQLNNLNIMYKILKLQSKNHLYLIRLALRIFITT